MGTHGHALLVAVVTVAAVVILVDFVGGIDDHRVATHKQQQRI